MCGIAAMVRADGRGWDAREREPMRRALAGLARRGPDGEGVREAAEGRALLGHRRLAVQDLTEGAAQPMGTADGSMTIVYNGEIYNAPEIRGELMGEGAAFRTRSDTEVLLVALERWGLERTLERVRGMFAFVAVRRVEGGAEVLAAVDHAGMKPLVWAMDGGVLVCASTCDAVRALMGEGPGLDRESVRRVLSVGYCPAPWTMWRGVWKLGAGMCLRWKVGEEDGPRVERWWRAPERVEEVAGVELEGVLAGVAREHLIGDVPVGMFLSGGLDSAGVGLALRRAGAEMGAVRAFTLATGDAMDEDGVGADVAARLGMPWTRVGFGSGEVVSMVRAAGEAFDEPQGYTAVLTAMRIARRVREQEPGVKVVIGGDGGDEALGGYAWHRDAGSHPLSLGAWREPTGEERREHEALSAMVERPGADGSVRGRALHALGRMSFVHRYLVRTFGGFHPAEACALVGEGAEGAGEGFAAWLGGEDRPEMPVIRRAQRLDVMGFCAGSILPKVDRACMSVGLELRSPFLDRRVLEAGLGAAVERGEESAQGSKPALRRMLGRGVEEGLVPRVVLERGKQGFSLRVPDREFEALAGVVDGSRLVGDGVVRADWAGFVPGEAGARRVRVFTLAMLAAWYEGRAGG